MNLGHYELVSRISVGGMAEIFRGRAIGAEGFEKPVVVKRILPEFASDQRFVDLLVAEARVHASLSHRNIVQIQDLGVSDEGETFVVFELVEGRDLGGLLAALVRAAGSRGLPNRLSDAVALYVAAELAEGVHCAHGLLGPNGQPVGLVHRDISPTNVLVSYAGEVKLADFGLAKRRTDPSVVVSLKGKLGYMSPEQARREPLDRRSDIFALGAVLFEMLCGRPLRDIEDAARGWQEIAEGRIGSPKTFRPDLAPVLVDLLGSALSADPAGRFAEASLFAAACRKALDQVPRARSSEAAELAKVLTTLLPPGSSAPQHEPSKLLRLKSQFVPQVGSPRPLVAPPPLPPDAAVRQRTPPRAVPTVVPAPFPSKIAPPQTPEQSSRPWVWIAAVLVGVAMSAGVVQVAVAPLSLLHVWARPARFHFASDPPGAEILVDGEKLPERTPTSTDVKRDRQGHVVEFRRDGFATERELVRYDRSRELAVRVRLVPRPRPSFEPLR